MAAPVLWGSEIVVNGAAAGNQAGDRVVALRDGTFFVVWSDDHSNADESGNAIKGQFFNADGTKKGGELTINTTTADDQVTPQVAVLADGRLIVAWTDYSGAENDELSGVRARIVDPSSPLSGKEFHVNSTLPSGQYVHSVAALSEGGFVIAYGDNNGDGSSAAVRAQVYNAYGDRVGSEVLLNQTTTDRQIYPAVTGLAGGNYAVFYTDGSQTGDDTSGFSIRGRIFSPTGQGGAEFLVNTGTKGDQAVAVVTPLASGRVVVLWISDDEGMGDGDGASIKGQIFNADGSKYRGEFLVNTTTRGDQTWPAVTALEDGGFAAVFMDSTNGSGDYNARVVTFDADGQLRSEDVLATAGTAGLQIYPHIAQLSDGRLVVTWTNQVDPAAETNVHAQILDPRDHAVTFAGTALDDQYVGTAHGDRLGGGGGADRLRGEAGDDVLDGGAGADRLDGGAGFDTVSYAGSGPVSVNLVTGANSDGDTLVAIEGAIGSAHADTLTGSTGHTLQGSGGNDVYAVSGSATVVEAGGQGLDMVIASGSYSLALSAEVEVLRFDNPAGTTGFSLSGSDMSNRIDGNNGANVIQGQGGGDVLRGGLGNDQLWGGAGRDIFVFDARLNSRSNKDTVKDYRVADDQIWLDNAVFKALGKKGSEAKPQKLSSSMFHAGSAAHDASDRIIYNKKTGALSYDADGTGKGAQVQIATLSKNLKMTYAEFFVI